MEEFRLLADGWRRVACMAKARDEWSTTERPASMRRPLVVSFSSASTSFRTPLLSMLANTVTELHTYGVGLTHSPPKPMTSVRKTA